MRYTSGAWGLPVYLIDFWHGSSSTILQLATGSAAVSKSHAGSSGMQTSHQRSWLWVSIRVTVHLGSNNIQESWSSRPRHKMPPVSLTNLLQQNSWNRSDSCGVWLLLEACQKHSLFLAVGSSARQSANFPRAAQMPAHPGKTTGEAENSSPIPLHWCDP